MSDSQGWVPDVSTFGARLALVRQRMGWTNIKEAATLCAISPENWRRWEAGRTEPRALVTTCMKIAGVTGVDYRWLALGPEGPAPVPTSAEHASTRRYVPGQRVVATIAPPPADPDGRTVRTRPIADRHPSLGPLSVTGCR